MSGGGAMAGGSREPVDGEPPAGSPQTVDGEQPVSLFDRAGGPAAMREVVDRLYARLIADPRVSGYFDQVDMPALKRHQVLLLSQVLGGPAQYRGRDLAVAHADLNIRADDYACVRSHLLEVLTDVAAPTDVIDAVAGVLDDVEADIVRAP